MEPYKYEIDMAMEPVNFKGRMAGIAKNMFGVYAFNKLRKFGNDSDSLEGLGLNDPEPLAEQPVLVNEYIFYEPGIEKVEDMLRELFDRYMEYCPEPDSDVMDRAFYVFSLLEYVKGTKETDGTEA